MTPHEASSNRERVVSVANGWLMLTVLIALLLGDIGLFIYSIAAGSLEQPIVSLLVTSLLLVPVIIILMSGLFTLQPNEARVLVLFGAYKGHRPDRRVPLGQSVLFEWNDGGRARGGC